VYGLKKGIDLSFLTDREVIQVCVGSFDIIFNFDDNVSISIVGQFNYFDRNNEFQWTPTPEGLNAAGHAIHLLGATVERFEAVRGVMKCWRGSFSHA
jgi:hypothetical protein